MIHKFNYENDTRVSVPIGIPAANVQIYILDKDLNPVYPNSTGEIYISGDGVARGYLNMQDLTMERFIENPFLHGKRMYKTGDLARFISWDKIEYIGRADKQIKIRGYRIETGEIEKYLLNHEAVKDAIVIDIEDKNNGKYLCAYFVKKSEISISELNNYLLQHLPNYMVPLYYIELQNIPLTINGKVNRELLPKPNDEEIDISEVITFRNEKEKSLSNAICDILRVEKVSVKQNFFQLGGDSIKAIQISSRLREQGLKLKVKDILANPIIENMALYVEESKEQMISQEHCDGYINPTPIVSWFLSQGLSNPNYYNQSILLEIRQEFESSSLEIVLNELINHHDSLRINFSSKIGQLFYNGEHLKKRYTIQQYDLRDLPYTMQTDKMNEIAEILKASIDIECGILIKACLFILGRNDKKLLITAHHLIVDGISWRIIVNDINSILKQIVNEQKIVLPLKTDSYMKWAIALEQYSKKVSDEEKKYWTNVLNKTFTFPTDFDLGEHTIENCCTVTKQLSEEVTMCLLTNANSSYGTEPRDLLIASLVRTIKETTGTAEIVIELEGHGREDIFEGIDISRTVGWFTNLYPFYINFELDNISDQIKLVKEELRKIPNKGIGFGVLKYLSKSLCDNNDRYVRFNYLGDFTNESDYDYVRLLNEQIGSESSKENKLTCLLDINCFLVENKINVQLTYSKNNFIASTMEAFLDNLLNNIKMVINHCCNREKIEFTPSDFDVADLSMEDLKNLFG